MFKSYVKKIKFCVIFYFGVFTCILHITCYVLGQMAEQNYLER